MFAKLLHVQQDCLIIVRVLQRVQERSSEPVALPLIAGQKPLFQINPVGRKERLADLQVSDYLCTAVAAFRNRTDVNPLPENFARSKLSFATRTIPRKFYARFDPDH